MKIKNNIYYKKENLNSDEEIIKKLKDDVYMMFTIWQKSFPPAGSYVKYENTYYVKNKYRKNILIKYQIFYFENKGRDYAPTLMITLIKGKKTIHVKSIIDKEVFQLIDMIEELENFYTV